MSRDELAVALDELAASIRALGEAIDDEESSSRLQPPGATDILRVTDERAIPALIALLEAQIRTLRLLQRGSQFVRRGRSLSDRTKAASGPSATESQSVLENLGTTLEQIGRRIESESIDDEIRTLYERTRTLYEDMDRRLREPPSVSPDDADGYRIDIREPGQGTSDTEETDHVPDSAEPSAGERGTGQVDVDVDAELETLRERFGTNETEEPPESTDDTSGEARDDIGESTEPDEHTNSDGESNETANDTHGSDTAGDDSTDSD